MAESPLTDPPVKSPASSYDAASNWLDKTGKKFNPYHGTGFLEPQFVPFEQTRRYINQDFGYFQGADIEDFYAQRQSGLEKLAEGFMVKLPLTFVTKTLSGVGYLTGLANPVNWFSDEGYFNAAADNAISGVFNNLEDRVKNDWFPTFQEAADRDKGFFARAFTDANFWAEDFVDGAAFMASAFIPGAAASKLGAGVKLAQGLSRTAVGLDAAASLVPGLEVSAANYFRNAANLAKTIDKATMVGLATASESMVEAKGIRDNVLLSLKDLDIPEDEKKQIAGRAARNGFLMNAALLGATNFLELNYFYKLLGKSDDVARGVIGGNTLTEAARLAEPAGRLGRFLQSNKGAFLKGAGASVLREGLVEENMQLAIQRVNEEYGKAGKALSMKEFYKVFGQYKDQTIAALSGQDTEASMNIGLGGLLGGVMGGVGDVMQARRDRDFSKRAVETLNQAQNNWLKFGNIYQTTTEQITNANGETETRTRLKLDSAGNPMVDETKLADTLTDLKLNLDALNQSRLAQSPVEQQLLRNQAFAHFVQAHVNAGIADSIFEKLDGAKKVSPEELIKLGFDPDNKNIDQDLDTYRTIAKDIVDQNKLIDRDILFTGRESDGKRKQELLNLASRQAVSKVMASKLQAEADEIRNSFTNSENSSLSDGLVDQLNELRLKILKQERTIDNLKTSGTSRAIDLQTAEKILSEIQSRYDTVVNQNPEGMANLKQDADGFFLYEKDERNDPLFINNYIRKVSHKADFENNIRALGMEFGMYADAIKGADNFENAETELAQRLESQITEPDEEIINPDQPGTTVTWTDENGVEQSMEFKPGQVFVGKLTQIEKYRGLNKNNVTQFNNDKIRIHAISEDGSTVTVSINGDLAIEMDAKELAQLAKSEKWKDFTTLSDVQKSYLSLRNKIVRYRVISRDANGNFIKGQNGKYATEVVGGRVSLGGETRNELNFKYVNPRTGKVVTIPFQVQYVVDQADITSLPEAEQVALQMESQRIAKNYETQAQYFDELINETEASLQNAESRRKANTAEFDRVSRELEDFKKQLDDVSAELQANPYVRGRKSAARKNLERLQAELPNKIAEHENLLKSLQQEKQDLEKLLQTLNVSRDVYYAALNEIQQTGLPFDRGGNQTLGEAVANEITELEKEQLTTRFDQGQLDRMISQTAEEIDQIDDQIGLLTNIINTAKSLLRKMMAYKELYDVLDDPNVDENLLKFRLVQLKKELQNSIQQKRQAIIDAGGDPENTVIMGDTTVQEDQDKLGLLNAFIESNNKGLGIGAAYTRKLISDIREASPEIEKLTRKRDELAAKFVRLNTALQQQEFLNSLRERRNFLSQIQEGLTSKYAKAKERLEQQQKINAAQAALRAGLADGFIDDTFNDSEEGSNELPSQFDEPMPVFEITGLMKTFGRHLTPDRKYNAENANDRFYKFTDANPIKNLFLMPVTAANDTFGIRREDQFKDDIKLVVMKKVGDDYKYVGMNGEVLDNPTADNIVYTSMGGNAVLLGEDKVAAVNEIFKRFAVKGSTAKEVLEDLNQFVALRNQVKERVAKGEKVFLPVVDKSRGVQARLPKDEVTGRPQEHNLVGRLIADDITDWNSPTHPDGSTISLEVATTDRVQNTSIPAGRPVIVKDNTVFRVYNSDLTQDQKNNVIEALKVLSKLFPRKSDSKNPLNQDEERDFNDIIRYLSGVVYWSLPDSKDTVESAFNSNRLYVYTDPASGSVTLFRGPDGYVFNEQEIEANRDKIVNGLKHNVSNPLLSGKRKNEPFYDLTVKDGKVTRTRKYTNYQHYMLEPREDGSSPIYTNVPLYTGKDGIETQMNSVYLIFGSDIKEPGAPVSNPIAAKKEFVATSKRSLSEMQDGRYQMKAETGRGVKFTVTFTVQGGSILSDFTTQATEPDGSPYQNLDALNKVVTAITESIAEGNVNDLVTESGYSSFQMLEEQTVQTAPVITTVAPATSVQPVAPVTPVVEQAPAPAAPVVSDIEAKKAEADKFTPIEQNFADGQGGRKMQPQFAGKSTMDLILSGDRTRTTRANTDIQRMLKDYGLTKIEDLVGKVIRMTDKQGRTAYTEITKVAPFTKEYQDATWQQEGWEKGVTDKLVGQYPYAIEFKLAALEGAKPAEVAPTSTPSAEDRPIEYGEVFVTGTRTGEGDIYGNRPKFFPDRRMDAEYEKGTKQYFAEAVIKDKKIFTLVDTTILDDGNRKGFIATSIAVDKTSPTTLADVKADLEAIHARTMSGVGSDRKINGAKVAAALTGVRWVSRKPGAASVSASPATSQPEVNDAALAAILNKYANPQFDEDTNFRVKMTDFVETEDFTKLDEFMQKSLPQIPVQRVGTLINNRAWGQFKNGIIYLFENAEIGTGYHEAFEAVWNAYLTDKEQQDIINEVKARPGYQQTEAYKATKQAYPGASENQIIKEMVAEEFRAHMLAEQENQVPQTLGQKIMKFFRDLMNFIKKWMGLSQEEKDLLDSKISQVFAKITSGEYANAKPVRDLSKVVPQYRTIKDTTPEFTKDIVEGLTSSFFMNLYRSDNNIDALFQDQDNNKLFVDLLNASMFDETSGLIGKLISPFRNALGDYEQALGYKLDAEQRKQFMTQFATVDPNIYYKLYLGTNLEAQKELAGIFKTSLEKYGFTFKEKIDEDDFTQVMNKEETVENPLGILDSINIDPRKMTSANVKLLIASLTDDAYVNNTIKPQVNSLGLLKPVNYGKALNMLLNELNGTVSVYRDGKMVSALELMFEKLDKKFKVDGRYKDGYVWIQRLKARLKLEDFSGNKIAADSLTEDDIRLMVAFEKNFTNNQNVPLKLILGNDNAIYNASPVDTINERRIRDIWENNIKDTANPEDKKDGKSLLFINNQGKIVFDKESQDFYTITNAITTEGRIEGLKMMGIEFTYSNLILEGDTDASDKSFSARLNKAYNSIVYGLTTDKEEDQINSFDDLFSRQKVNRSINDLLKIEAEMTAEDNILSHQTADGKIQYSITIPSTYANVLNSLRNVETQADFIRSNPHLGTVDSQGNVTLFAYQGNSRLISRDGIIFDKNGRKRKNINYHLISGIGMQEDGAGKPTDKLQFTDRVVQEIHYIMNGIFYTPINSDKASEFGLETGLMIDFSDVEGSIKNNQAVLDLYLMALEDEMDAAFFERDAKLPNKVQYYREAVYNLGHFNGILGPKLVKRFQEKVLTGKESKNDFLMSYDVMETIGNYLEKQTKDVLAALTDIEVLTRTETEEAGVSYSTKAISSENLNRVGISDPQNMSEAAATNLVQFLLVNKQLSVFEQHKLIYGHPGLYKDFAKRSNGATSTKEPIVDNEVVLNWMDKNMRRLDGKTRGNEQGRQVMNVVSYKDVLAASDYIKDNDAYTSLKEADAQAWIMPDMYRDLLFLSGKWTKDMEDQWQYEIAYEIANNRANAGRYTAEEKKNAQEFIKQFRSKGVVFPVLKPQFFGYAKNQMTHTVFLKNSVQPKFFRMVQGTQFEKVYNNALNNSIDIIGFESGQKVGNVYDKTGSFVSLYNNDGSITETLPPVQTLFTKFFGIQVEQPAIFKDLVVRGTQVTKLIMSNFLINGKAINEEVDGLIKEYNSIIQQLVTLGKSELLKELGIQRQSNGEYNVVDLENLVNLLRNEAEKRNLPDNIIESLAVNPEDGKLQTPFDALPIREKIDNVINSIIDSRVISDKMNGKPLVQVAYTGYEFENRKMVYLKDGVYTEVADINELTKEQLATVRVTSGDLKFYRMEDGKIASMEVYLPWFFKGVTPEKIGLEKGPGNIYKFKPGAKIDERLLKAIGFRIPTQAMNSIDSIVIKGFLPREAGDMVVVPSEIVGKAGSDFDIDKLNTYLGNYYFLDGKLEYVDPKMSEEELTSIAKKLWAQRNKTAEDTVTDPDQESFIASFKKKALQNRLIEVMGSLITQPENYRQLITPNGAANMKAMSQEINTRKEVVDEEKSLTKMSEFIPMAITRERYVTGKQLVGIAALQTTSHAMFQVSGTELSGMYATRGLRFMHGANAKAPVRIRMDHNKTSDGKLYLYADKAKDERFISDMHSEGVSAFVDTANDPFVFYLNLNLNTASTWFYLQKLGVPLDQLSYFFTQPILEKYFKELGKNKTVLRQATKGTLNNAIVIGKVLEPYLAAIQGNKFVPFVPEMMANPRKASRILSKAVKGILSYRNNNPSVSLDQLKKSIELGKSNRITREEAFVQAAILMDYLEYNKQGQQLTGYIRAIGYDNTSTKTLIENRLQEINWNLSEADEFIANPDNILEQTFIGEMKAQKEDIFRMYKDFFVSLDPKSLEVFTPLFEKFADPDFFMLSENKQEVLERYQNFYINYLIHTVPYAKDGIETTINSKYNILFGSKSVAHQLKKLQKSKDPKIKNNLFLKELFPLIASEAAKTNNIKLFRKRLDAYENNVIIDSAANLYDYALQVGNKELQKLVEDIAVLAILQSGVQNSPISYTKILPVQIYSQVVSSVINTFRNGSVEVDPKLVWKQFHQNNWRNQDIVPVVDRYVSENGLMVFMSENDYVLNRTLKPGLKEDKKRLNELRKAGKWEEIYDYALFEKVPFQDIYRPVNRLGDGYRFTEVYTQDRKKSMFLANKPFDESVYDEQVLQYMGDEYASGEMMPSIDLPVETEQAPAEETTPAATPNDMGFDEWYNTVAAPWLTREEALKEYEQLRKPVTTQSPVKKVISGGQTGVDRLGLEVGRGVGLQTGGTATPGFVTERGKDETLRDFGVEEISTELQGGKSGSKFYLPRTEQNVINSDGTVYFATDEDSAGKIATERFARQHNKPFLLNPTAAQLREWLIANNVETLNVAGNRGSKISAEQLNVYRNILREALSNNPIQDINTYAPEGLPPIENNNRNNC